MAVNKRKKSTKMRGATTHGYGSMKKNRGAGHRGGRGRAGSGKRGDSKKPSGWKKKYFGKSGFKSKARTARTKGLNIRDLEERLGKLLAQKLISKEKEFYVVDMEKLGYNKLLSGGKALNKFRIKVPYASAKAVEKIKSTGGEIEVAAVAEAEKIKKE